MNDPNTGMAFETKGVVTLNGEEVFVQRMSTGEASDLAKNKADAGSDARLLGLHLDRAGRRRLDLSDAVQLMTEEELEDFPATEVRAAREFLLAVSEGPGNLARYHVDWQRLLGISDGTAVCQICEVLRLLNIPSLAAGEQLVRWLVQLEVATERNYRSPDFSGLGIILGRAQTRKFNEHLTNKLKERAQIWKSERQFSEEKRQWQQSAAASGKDADKPDGKGGKGEGGLKGGGRGSASAAADGA